MDWKIQSHLYLFCFSSFLVHFDFYHGACHLSYLWKISVLDYILLSLRAFFTYFAVKISLVIRKPVCDWDKVLDAVRQGIVTREVLWLLGCSRWDAGLHPSHTAVAPTWRAHEGYRVISAPTVSKQEHPLSG